MRGEPQSNVIRKGVWRNAEGIVGHIWIICQNWDYFHEEFYDEGPDLNQQGFAYYVLYGSSPELENHSSRSPTCFSENEAIRRAEELLDNVQWLS